jgi:hypothetical protein
MPHSPIQLALAVEVMQEYLCAPPDADGKTPVEMSAECDQERAHVIEAELKPLVKAYLSGTVPLDEFKPKIHHINMQHKVWGFTGAKGMMFFSMIRNVAHGAADCDQQIKAAIATPTNEAMAHSQIIAFASYIRSIGDAFVEGGGTNYGRPKITSVPFFLSYFWQIQERDTWPVYYPNGVNTMNDLNLWQPTEDIADNYIEFKHVYQELAEAFTQASGRKFDLYGVEYVFWFKGGNPRDSVIPKNGKENPPIPVGGKPVESLSMARLPDSYIPPVISVLPQLARNEPGFDELAKASGTSLPRAFEKGIHVAFTILGYDTELRGQGSGRKLDGIALAPDGSYAILWDGKSRENGYSMGTDDRAIREYIKTTSRELKKRRGSPGKIYYVLVSSNFADDFNDTIGSIKMETEISEVCLLEAAALVEMVNLKLRDPQVTLGPDGLQRLFGRGGIITQEAVTQSLG